MAKGIPLKIALWLNAGLVGLSLSLWQSNYALAQECTNRKIRANITQFKDYETGLIYLQAVIGCNRAAVPALIEALKDKNEDVRSGAAIALREIGTEAKTAVPKLTEVLKDNNENVRSGAASTLLTIAKMLEIKANALSESDLDEIANLKKDSSNLKKALKILEEPKKEFDEATVKKIRLSQNAIQDRLNNLEKTKIYQLSEWVKNNPGVLIPFAYLIWNLGIFWLRPIWLLKLDEILKPVALKIPIINLELSPRILLFLKYHSRVLDAWVNAHLDLVSFEFRKKETVKDRAIHISVPVTLDGQNILELSGKDLKSTFEKKRGCLLILGEGGAGKTSLACQIAQWGMANEAEQRLCQHRMFPLLIEQELESQDFKQAIRGQLQDLINAVKPITEELLNNLLWQRRLLIIVDHLSEMSEATRQKIQPNSPKFPVNALIVTSRLEEKLGGVNKTLLKPLRVEGNRLSKFMDAYLAKKSKRDLFDDEEYFDACRRLSRMVGERNITVLLARMYADQFIAAQEGTQLDSLPENIPDLMLSYLNKLNRTVEKSKQRNNLKVHRDAQVVAWECLKQTYQPGHAMRKDVVTALAAPLSETEETETESHLQYLENRLRLIQTIEPGNKIRLVLDPLAEYLAALYLVNSYCNSEEEWKKFLTTVDDGTKGSLDAIKGFLLAVRDCCLAKQNEAKIPDFVPVELGKKAGLDPEAIQAAQRIRRVWKLIEDLKAPESNYRLRSVRNLATMGQDAIKGKAVSPLLKVLENNSEEAEIRLEVIKTLKKLGVNETFKQLLQRLLENESEKLEIRLKAFENLKEHGVDTLLPIVEIKANVWSIRLIEPPLIEKIDLGNDVKLDLIEIPAGSFVMGAPESEKNSSNSERPQHEVKVKPFLMGKFPVTQAQWRVVAHLPKINRQLKPDPSRVQGDNRPVERVSWYSAVEFCQRLSILIGKEYRLPSEAEWEYACRAGTSTPFHFGETIKSELANYNGTSIYADEPKGKSRKQTTDVGKFPPNAFGLYDMHGNVWEWCADDWHDNYEGAPTDGRAWLDSNERANINLENQSYFDKNNENNAYYAVLRGGSWYLNPDNCRSAFRYYSCIAGRNYFYNYYGFRVVCVGGRTQ